MSILKFNCGIFIIFLIPGFSRGTDYNNDLVSYTSSFPDHSYSHNYYNCTWRTLYGAQKCPGFGVNFYYYSGKNRSLGIQINPLVRNSLQETNWDPHKHNIIYIHDYGGIDGIFPSYILRDAYIKNGSYNVFVVDWSTYARTPCYASAIHNINAVAKCTAQLYSNIRAQGIPSKRITCVGHGLGAHGCGLISRYIDFRIHRIIGVDPSGPMIPTRTKLKAGMADYVQVIYTNAGGFGDFASTGKINFCVNGGKIQQLCKNSSIGLDLCSHLISICYLAESIDVSTARLTHPCSRQCPYGPRVGSSPGRPVLLGQHAPDWVSGSYCLYTSEIPYCSEADDRNGHPWCCLRKDLPVKEKDYF